MKFILIPPGEFMMGSTREEIEMALTNLVNSHDKHFDECFNSEAPRHKVALTRPCYLGVHEVTQNEYEIVMGQNPSYFVKTSPDERIAKQFEDIDTTDHPVESVSWNDAAEFCARLSKQEELNPFYFRAAETVTALKGTGYRLPTEAEWEFACRAGTTTWFWNDDEVPAGWFRGNSAERTHEVEELEGNPFGLYDVNGNVLEWVEDGWQPTFYASFADKPAIDPRCAFSAGTLRVTRGGVWDADASRCRSSARDAYPAAQHFGRYVGFRVALPADALRRDSPVARRGSERTKTEDLSSKISAPNPKSKVENSKSAPPSLPAISEMALVTEPATIPGAKSWILETIDHRGDIYKMEFNPEGTLLATYGEDGAVRLWNSETGELARIFVGADSPSGGIAWSPDGASIAVAAGTKIRAWQAATGNNVCTIALSDGEAASLAWSPDGKTFAVGQRPVDQPEAPARHLCLYDVATGKLISDRHRDDWNIEQIAWSPDGKRLLIDGEGTTGWLTEAASGSAQSVGSKLVNHQAIAWTCDGIPVFAGPAEVDKKSVIQVWRADTDELLDTFRAEVEGEQPMWTALSRDARFLLVGCKDGAKYYPLERAAYLYDIQTRNVVRHIDRSPDHPGPWVKGEAPVWSWEYSPRFAVAPAGDRFARFGQRFGGPAFFAINPDEQPYQRERTTTLVWYTDNANFCAAWSHNGESLAWRGEDGAVHFWSSQADGAQHAGPLPDGEYPWLRRSPAASFQWSRDGEMLAAAFDSLTKIDQYSADTGQLLSTHHYAEDHATHCWAPVLSSDGRYFAGGVPSSGSKVGIFRRAAVKPMKVLDAVAGGDPISWSPDGKRIACRTRDACEIWDVEINKCVHRLDGTGNISWSPDGARFVFATDGAATVHDAESGDVLSELADAPKGMWRWPRFTWSPDGSQVAAVGRTWNAAAGDVAMRLPRAARGGNTGAPAWSSDGTKLAYLGPGRAVTIVHPASNRVTAVLLTFSRGQTVAIEPSGHHRASPRADDLFAYVVQTADGQETLSRAQFAERFGWNNDAGWALAREDGPPVPSSNERNDLGRPSSVDTAPNPKSKIENPKSRMALVQRPAALPGIESWTITPRSSPFAWEEQPIALSPDAKWVACAGEDGAVRLIDVASGMVNRVFIGHDAALAAVSFSADSTLLASLGAGDGNARIWNVKTGAQLRSVYVGLADDRSALHWSPDGAVLAISVYTLPIKLLDVASGEFLPAPIGGAGLPGPRYMAWSPDSRRFVSHDGGQRIWELATLKPVASLERPFTDGLAAAFAWSPDGTSVFGYSGIGKIRIWDSLNGKLLKELDEKNGGKYPPRLAPFGNGKQLIVSTGAPQGARIWDLASGEPDGDVMRFERNHWFSGFELSADGQTLATYAGRSAGLFNLSTRTLVKEIPFSAWAESAAWSPDGHELAVTGDGMAVWSSGAHRGLSILPAENLYGAQWLPSGDTIVNHNCIFQRQGAHWDRKPLPIELPGTSNDLAVVSPDGARLACVSRDADAQGKHHICIWDIATAKRLIQMEPLAPYTVTFAWSPDGTLLAAGGASGPTAVYNATTGERIAELPFNKDWISAHGLAWSPDGKTLAAGYGDGVVRLCDLNGEGLKELNCDTLNRYRAGTEEIAALRWSRDGRTLQVFDHYAAYVFDALTADLLAKTSRLDRTPNDNRPKSFSPDGRYLAVATTCTRVWDCSELNAAAERALRGEGERGRGTERGNRHVSGDAEGDLTVVPADSTFDAATSKTQDLRPKTFEPNPKLKLVASVVPLGNGQAVVVSADGHWLGTRGAEKEIVYVVKTAAGQETLAPREFYKRFGWKNDPGKVKLPD